MRAHPRNETAQGGNESYCSPFLKWPGGKRRLATRLLALLPHGRRLIEPFVGAGAVFAASDFPEYVLADANPDLISLYRSLREQPDELLRASQRLFEDADGAVHAYYERRERFNALPLGIERAALFVYLNRFGFNGLCRYNRAGEFNVPAGRFTVTPALPLEQMVQWSIKLQRVELRDGDFASTLLEARSGDVVFCDPPYSPTATADCFANYTGAGFTWDDHLRLVATAKDLAGRGIPVLITNHDTAATRELYCGATLFRLEAHRSIGSRALSRVKVPEVAAVFSDVAL